MAAVQYLDDVTVKLINNMGGDETITQAARVSTVGLNAGGADTDADKGLINFLMRDKHGSPFEHNSMTFFVKAPIFVFREFHRHRVGFSYNEMSGRYTELPPEFYIPKPERPLIQTGKPGHYQFNPGTEEQYRIMFDEAAYAYSVAWDSYQTMLARGIAKEVARIVLPVGIMSQMYVTCNARSLMHFLSLRTNEPSATFPSKPQHEIELVARQMEGEFNRLFPVTYEAWHRNGRVAP